MARLAAGTMLAGYRIERFLGQGGMGIVYLASQLSLDRPIALKLIAPERALGRGVPRALPARVAPRGLDRSSERRAGARGG